MRLIFYGEYTDLNTYIKAERTNKFIAAKIKKEETERIYWQALSQKNIDHDFSYPITVQFVWFITNGRKDPDNIRYASKAILDGLVKAGILENDGQKQIAGFTDVFFISDSPRVEVTIVPAREQKQKNPC